MKKIILASTSPRRKILLEKSGISFDIVPSNYEEDMTLNMEPEELAKYLAFCKAKDISKKYANHIIIAADTFIVYDGKLLGKPRTKENAVQTLTQLSGNTISVVSGVAIIDSSCMDEETRSVKNTLHIKELTSDEIDGYVATGEPLDCAGAFNISKKGRFIIKKIEGNYTNVMGLPMKELEEMLAKHKISFTTDVEKWLRKKLAI